MTTLENKYWELQESIRHNQEMEKVANLEANTKVRHQVVEENLLPYQKAKLVTDSIANSAGALQNVTKSASNIGSLFKLGS